MTFKYQLQSSTQGNFLLQQVIFGEKVGFVTLTNNLNSFVVLQKLLKCISWVDDAKSPLHLAYFFFLTIRTHKHSSKSLKHTTECNQGSRSSFSQEGRSELDRSRNPVTSKKNMALKTLKIRYY